MDLRQTRLIGACMVLLLAAVAVSSIACKDERRHATASGLQLPETAPPIAPDARPADVARAFLESVRDAQHARERGFGSQEQKQAYEAAMAKLHSLAATKAIYDGVRASRSVSIPKDITEEGAVTLALESWVSLVAYSVDGFLFDTITVITGNAETNPSVAAVRLEAERPEDASKLRELEARLATSGTTQPAGDRNSPAYYQALRAEGVAQRPPLNVPIRASIIVALVHDADGWRVAGVQVGPGSIPVPPSAPNPTLPATTAFAAPSTTAPAGQ